MSGLEEVVGGLVVRHPGVEALDVGCGALGEEGHSGAGGAREGCREAQDGSVLDGGDFVDGGQVGGIGCGVVHREEAALAHPVERCGAGEGVILTCGAADDEVEPVVGIVDVEAVSGAYACAVRVGGRMVFVGGGAGFFRDGGGLDSFLCEAEGLLAGDEEGFGEALFANFADDAFVVEGGGGLGVFLEEALVLAVLDGDLVEGVFVAGGGDGGLSDLLVVGELGKAGGDDAVVRVEADGEPPVAVGAEAVEVGEGIAPELAKFCRFMEVGADVVGVGLVGEAEGDILPGGDIEACGGPAEAEVRVCEELGERGEGVDTRRGDFCGEVEGVVGLALDHDLDIGDGGCGTDGGVSCVELMEDEVGDAMVGGVVLFC